MHLNLVQNRSTLIHSFICVLCSAVVDPVTQSAASTTLCVELLSVLNNCGPAHGDVASSLLQVALQWIESSPMSVLLLPMMSSACQCLASTSHMVRVVETCCDTYFCRGTSVNHIISSFINLCATLASVVLSSERYK